MDQNLKETIRKLRTLHQKEVERAANLKTALENNIPNNPTSINEDTLLEKVSKEEQAGYGLLKPILTRLILDGTISKTHTGEITKIA